MSTNFNSTIKKKKNKITKINKIYYQTKLKVTKLAVNLNEINKVIKLNTPKNIINKILAKTVTQFTTKLSKTTIKITQEYVEFHKDNNQLWKKLLTSNVPMVFLYLNFLKNQ